MNITERVDEVIEGRGKAFKCARPERFGKWLEKRVADASLLTCVMAGRKAEGEWHISRSALFRIVEDVYSLAHHG